MRTTAASTASPSAAPPTTSSGRWAPTYMRLRPTMGMAVTTRAAGRPETGKGGGAQGNGDASVPGHVPETSGLAPAAAGAGYQDRRPGTSDYTFDQFRKRPGASATGQEPDRQFTLTRDPGRAGSGRGGTKRAQLHDNPGGHVNRVGQAVDGAE